MKLPKRTRLRNPNPMPLFQWADQHNRHVLPILATHIPQTLALARRHRLPVAIAAVFAEATEARQ